MLIQRKIVNPIDSIRFGYNSITKQGKSSSHITLSKLSKDISIRFDDILKKTLILK